MLAALLLASSAAASDHPNLEDGLPITVTDAQPIAYLGREFQFLSRYELGREEEDRLLLEPRLEFGIIRNGQITLAGPVLLGEDMLEGLRELRAEALYAINREGLVVPGFAVDVATNLPVTAEDASFDPTVELLATKSVPGTTQLHQVHANAALTFNTDEDPGERAAAYELVLGYSARLFNDLIVLANIVREQELEEEVEINLGGLGLRYQLNPWIVISGGTEFGFAAESPQVRPSVALQAAI